MWMKRGYWPQLLLADTKVVLVQISYEKMDTDKIDKINFYLASVGPTTQTADTTLWKWNVIVKYEVMCEMRSTQIAREVNTVTDIKMKHILRKSCVFSIMHVPCNVEIKSLWLHKAQAWQNQTLCTVFVPSQSNRVLSA